MTPIAVVSGCIRQGDRFYVGRRTGACAGCWEFLGGKVDPGETPKAALARELMEEAKVLVSVGSKIVSTPVLRNVEKDFIVTLYEVEIVLGTPQITEDHSEVAWLTLSDLLDLNPTEMTPSMPYFLKALQQSPSERFHAHLDECGRCSAHPFDLCGDGQSLLEETAGGL